MIILFIHRLATVSKKPQTVAGLLLSLDHYQPRTQRGMQEDPNTCNSCITQTGMQLLSSKVQYFIWSFNDICGW